MTSTSIFSDMLQTITDRGRKLLAFAPRSPTAVGASDIEHLCELLLSSRGEASGMALAAQILDHWSRLNEPGQRNFMLLLFNKFGPDEARLDAAIESYRADRTPSAMLELHQAAEPRRQELIRRLNLAPNGISTMVNMRERLLSYKIDSPELEAVDADFSHLFASWFNRGFLLLRPIDWSTPAHILEKIIRYEAVHEISDWDELRRRLAPADRRCFAFFHPQLADDPLIFVEVALTKAIPEAIFDVLDESRAPIAAQEARTAVFYSISNCQMGLRGISFGNFLIKQVVEDLRREFPKLETFVTLSPVSGFANWLSKERKNEHSELLTAEDKSALQALDGIDWVKDPKLSITAKEILLPLAACYFLNAKTHQGRPLEPVSRFHLGNGARLERINFLADRSDRAMRQGHGFMVNYLYKLDDIEANHEAFAQRNEVVAAPPVRKLLRQDRNAKKVAPSASNKNRETNKAASKEPTA
ncbi:malonyl-CoA decarboxylase [Phyllobacterium sp. YR531]|uniref:malonyl-CoA decarboxylase n=1 Tax=Phyllobacterium sp. YR531 TaxID=1144343 RepID=UPI00026FAA0D|nr:malonyl-CoA decarboxylase [Phyllobacterium sp. YR531]EJN02265.1 Malonyl-CoA decarboxylase (MCD) [Phyllobacterium sp. YR531]